ncbi:hypothetical protein PRIPAC_97695 [Pristionchus pacificus]|uniref:Uncharacterized protein n=1 Tax=Pristionchus pacificus TaxID=54126 RepID=A0A2A6BC20_PRIPA|nr:hypothetical protein PRIPAC_97695 [Pristionchus pacificus]|eukprot:PDM63417.1 hypothetical protein PRIPAC_53774 [Pristionchus pacificus]
MTEQDPIQARLVNGLFTIGYSVYYSEFESAHPQYEKECFPIVQTELLVNIKKFGWINSLLDCCSSETRDDYCYCSLSIEFDRTETSFSIEFDHTETSLSIEFDRTETLIWPIDNGTKGLADDWKIVHFERKRDNEIQFIKVNIGEKAFHFTLRFNSDLIASVTICKDTKAPYNQRHLVDEDEKLTQWYIANYKDDICGHITFQIIKEQEGNERTEKKEDGNERTEKKEDGNERTEKKEDGNERTEKKEDGNERTEKKEDGNERTEKKEDGNERTEKKEDGRET